MRAGRLVTRLAARAATSVPLLALAAAAPLGAQGPASRPPALWVGAGGTAPLSQPGLDRRIGAAGMAAAELPLPGRLWLRAEVSANAQDHDTRADGPLSGDVQQVRLVAAARWAPVAIGGLTPYALAGAGRFWQSERVVLRDLSNPVPDAAYRQTTSHTAAGLLLGGGATAAVVGLRIFAEARWTRLGADEGATSDLTMLGGVTLPLRW